MSAETGKVNPNGEYFGKKLLFVGASGHFEPSIKKAQEMGLYTIVINNNPNAMAKQYADLAADVDTYVVDEIVDFAREQKVDGLFTSWNDMNLFHTQAAAEKLGLPFFATKEQLDALVALRERYQKFVEDTLKKSFPKKTSVGALQAAAMEMPSVANMVAQSTYEKREVSGQHQECIGTHRERCGSHREWFSSWNPFTLFSREVIDYKTVKDYKTVTDYKNVKKVRMDEIAKKVTAEIRKVTLNNIETFKKRAADVVATAKNQVLAVMSEIDARVRAIQADLEKANADKAVLEAQIRECENKVAWIRDFNKKLNDILEV